MRHARKAAAQATMAVLLCATLNASSVGAAHATNSPGGTPAPSTPSAKPSGTTKTGGTGTSASAASNTGGSGGAVAPSTKGTGGSEYGVVAPKPKVVRKATRRKPSRTVRHAAPKPKPKPKPKPVAKPAPPKPAPPTLPPVSEPGVPSPAQTASEHAIFPVLGPHSFGDAANRFGAGRTGHIHQGQDVLASEGLTVIAPLAGTIVTTAYQAGGAGWYAAEHTVDGLDFFYAHCQAGSLAVATGQAVSAGQAICRVGQTGDATGPHLHFEIWIGGWQAAGGHPIDPLPYLEAWDQAAGG
jgi:murein DD-endopeptidase MepM/ murein hydrolase activator NlpD